MKIAILGATGQTGQALVQQALDDGHEVIAIVRNPGKMNIAHDKLTVVEANIFSDDDLTKGFQNVDAVMSTLGFPLDPKPVTGFSEVIRNIAKAMRDVHCQRLLIVHSWYTQKESREEAPPPIKSGLLCIIAPVLDNMREAEEYLETECNDIDYTVVLPPGLLNEPRTDAEFQVVDGKFHVPGGSSRIARADVARYMLNIIQDKSSYKKIQAITVRK